MMPRLQGYSLDPAELASFTLLGPTVPGDVADQTALSNATKQAEPAAESATAEDEIVTVIEHESPVPVCPASIYDAILPITIDQLREPPTSDKLAARPGIKKTPIGLWWKQAVEEQRVVKIPKPVRYKKAEPPSIYQTGLPVTLQVLDSDYPGEACKNPEADKRPYPCMAGNYQTGKTAALCNSNR